MKNLLLSITLLITALTTQASTVAVVSGYENGMTEARVVEDGRLLVTKSDSSVVEMRLSANALDRIKGMALSLYNAELKEEHRPNICKMLAIPTLSDLSVPGDVGIDEPGHLRLVLTETNCTVSYVVVPKDEWVLERATALRTMIVILALNTLN